MNTQMTERFNVAGAQLVKLFGDHDREVDDVRRASAAGVRDTGITLGDVRPGLLRRPRPRRRARRGGDLRRRRAPRRRAAASRRGTLVALAALVTRVYQPLTGLTNARVDLMTVDGQLRAGVRGARRARGDRRPTGRRRSRRARRAGRVRPRPVPLPAGADVTIAVARSTQRARRRRSRPRRARRRVARRSSRARPSPSSARPGAGKTTLASLIPRLYDVTGGAVRVDGHDVRDLTQDVAARRRSASSAQDPHLFHEHDRRQPALRQARRHRRRARRGVPRRRGSTTRSPRCPTATTRWSASAATG